MPYVMFWQYVYRTIDGCFNSAGQVLYYIETGTHIKSTKYP